MPDAQTVPARGLLSTCGRTGLEHLLQLLHMRSQGVIKVSAGLANASDRRTDAAEHGRPVGGLHALVIMPSRFEVHSTAHPRESCGV
jgi:hypothetical protein